MWDRVSMPELDLISQFHVKRIYFGEFNNRVLTEEPEQNRLRGKHPKVMHKHLTDGCVSVRPKV